MDLLAWITRAAPKTRAAETAAIDAAAAAEIAVLMAKTAVTTAEHANKNAKNAQELATAAKAANNTAISPRMLMEVAIRRFISTFHLGQLPAPSEDDFPAVKDVPAPDGFSFPASAPDAGTASTSSVMSTISAPGYMCCAAIVTLYGGIFMAVSVAGSTLRQVAVESAAEGVSVTNAFKSVAMQCAGRALDFAEEGLGILPLVAHSPETSERGISSSGEEIIGNDCDFLLGGIMENKWEILFWRAVRIWSIGVGAGVKRVRKRVIVGGGIFGRMIVLSFGIFRSFLISMGEFLGIPPPPFDYSRGIVSGLVGNVGGEVYWRSCNIFMHVVFWCLVLSLGYIRFKFYGGSSRTSTRRRLRNY